MRAGVSFYAAFGGNYNNTNNAGAWCVNVNYTPTNRNSNVGSRLSTILFQKNIKMYLLGVGLRSTCWKTWNTGDGLVA